MANFYWKSLKYYLRNCNSSPKIISHGFAIFPFILSFIVPKSQWIFPMFSIFSLPLWDLWSRKAFLKSLSSSIFWLLLYLWLHSLQLSWGIYQTIMHFQVSSPLSCTDWSRVYRLYWHCLSLFQFQYYAWLIECTQWLTLVLR